MLQWYKLIASGSVDETMLEALEDYVKRQKKRIGMSAKAEEYRRTLSSAGVAVDDD